MFSGVFSVADLQKSLERSNPDLGRATLFRAIDLFVKLGVLEKVHRESAEDGYIVGVKGQQKESEADRYNHLYSFQSRFLCGSRQERQRLF